LTALAGSRPSDAAAVIDRLGRYGPTGATWDGRRLADIAQTEVRSRILVADHDADLFAGPLREVVAGRDEPDDERVRGASARSSRSHTGCRPRTTPTGWWSWTTAGSLNSAPTTSWSPRTARTPRSGAHGTAQTSVPRRKFVVEVRSQICGPGAVADSACGAPKLRTNVPLFGRTEASIIDLGRKLLLGRPKVALRSHVWVICGPNIGACRCRA
jgi:hypothetical protein